MARIAVDARLLFYRNGGIPNYIAHLMSDLPDQDSEGYSYAFLQHRHDIRRFSPTQDIRRIPCLTPSHHSIERVLLGLELLPHRIDLLHSTDFIQPLFGYRKNVVTVHDLAFLRIAGQDQKQSKSFYLRYISDAIKRADHIITISHATRDDLLALFPAPPTKVTAIHLGIDPSFTTSSEAEIRGVRTRYGLPDNYLLFVGTIEPRKNITGLLTAYSILEGKMTSDIYPLVLVGQKGWNTESIFQQWEDSGLKEKTLWLENVTPEDLPAVYSGASLLVLPSHYEGFGFPPLEAMACGTPCVVAKNSSLPEIVGDAGVYVDNTLPESIAEGIRCVLEDDDLRRTLIEKGKERVKGFTWQNTIQHTLGIYRQVLGDLA